MSPFSLEKCRDYHFMLKVKPLAKYQNMLGTFFFSFRYLVGTLTIELRLFWFLNILFCKKNWMFSYQTCLTNCSIEHEHCKTLQDLMIAVENKSYIFFKKLLAILPVQIRSDSTTFVEITVESKWYILKQKITSNFMSKYETSIYVHLNCNNNKQLNNWVICEARTCNEKPFLWVTDLWWKTTVAVTWPYISIHLYLWWKVFTSCKLILEAIKNWVKKSYNMVM